MRTVHRVQRADAPKLRGGRGGWYAIAKYEFIAEQPDDATMRCRDDWSDGVKHSQSRRIE
jgi:hypothetical protein